MSHFDKLVKLPAGFEVIASTKNSEYAGIAHQTKPIYGTPLFICVLLLQIFC
jgi:GMP synthase (glutamine-hydrolysing)